MAQLTARDAVWDCIIKFVARGESFSSRDVIKSIEFNVTEKEVTKILENVSDLSWINEHPEADMCWIPRFKINIEKNTPIKSKNRQSASNTGVDSTPEGEENSNVTDEKNTKDVNTRNKKNIHTLNNIKTPSDLSRDKIYVGTVDRVSNNAIIDLPKGEVNLGPICEEAENEEVMFKPLKGVWGKCMTKKYTYDGYTPQDGQSSKSSSNQPSTDSSSRNSTTRVKPTKQGEVRFKGKYKPKGNNLLNGHL